MIQDLSFGIFCLFVVGCWVCLFVWFGLLECLWQSLGDPSYKHSLYEFGHVAVRQKLQMVPCWSICTVQLCLRGGSSPVTFYSSSNRGYFRGAGNNSLSSSVWCTELPGMHTERLQIHLCECNTSVNKMARQFFFLCCGCSVFDCNYLVCSTPASSVKKTFANSHLHCLQTALCLISGVLHFLSMAWLLSSV